MPEVDAVWYNWSRYGSVELSYPTTLTVDQRIHVISLKSIRAFAIMGFVISVYVKY